MAEKKVVLAIDDDIIQLTQFKLMLGQKYDLREVKSASNALHFLNTQKADLILLDIEMPNISGFEFLRDIRKIPSHIKVPIIIVSSNTTEEYFEKARKSSADDVLSKPVKSDMLIHAIEKALASKG